LKVGDIGSFRFRLAAYFVVLSLLPLAAAWWAFGAIAERSVRSSADARLESGLRAALAAYEDELAGLEDDARALARNQAFQRALTSGDRAAIAAALPGQPPIRIEVAGDGTIGRLPSGSAERRITVLGPGGETAIVAGLPIDDALLARLRQRSGLADDDRLLLVGAGTVEAGTVGAATIDGEGYRALGVALDDARGPVLAAAVPSDVLADERRSFQTRLLAGLLAAVALIGGVAYLAGRSIVGSLGRLSEAANAIAAGRLEERVEVHGKDEFAALGHAFNDMAEQLQERLADLEIERRRLRQATGRFGDALAATLDADQLMRVVVETAVEATSAGGGFVSGVSGSMVHVGDPLAGPDRIEVAITAAQTSFGTLVLLGERFEEADRIAAVSLAGHAAVALENARLHRIVERQALVDGLTGLANRRHLDQELASVLARAERAGGTAALILADLDDFKAVNDRHGHACGDLVLREFATLMHEVVREGDTAARWGGEEFALLLPDTDVEGAERVAERLRRGLESQVILSPEGQPLRVTVSLGVAGYPEAGGRVELVDAADEALYRAKRAGKNRVVIAARDGHAA
jgi:two-component system cell cycle response regulator